MPPTDETFSEDPPGYPGRKNDAGDEIVRISCSGEGLNDFDIRVVMVPNEYEPGICRLLCSQQGRWQEQPRWERAIAAGYMQYLTNRLGKARIPAIPEFACGLDGTTYELEFTCGFNSVTYRWWSDPPRGYEPLAQFVEKLVRLGGIYV